MQLILACFFITLELELVDYKAPVEEYNKNLKRILGRADISIEYVEKVHSYQLKRNNMVVEWKTFSEGEKTVLAITHFILSLKDEKDGKSIDDCIVVIDDPVCSLDTNALYSVYAFIKYSLKTSKQLIISTHHFYFFKLVQRWFENAKDTNDAKIKHKNYSIERKANTSFIINTPKYLIKFESEYQYLYSKMQDLKTADLTYEDCIALPNDCRKLLESIAVFINPFTEFPDTRIRKLREEIVRNFQGSQDELEMCLDYVYRCSNTESHLQLFDDALYFQNNPTEAKMLIDAIISFIDKLVPHLLVRYNEQ